MLGRPSLPDGLVVIVKHECETCKMIAPLLAQFEATSTRKMIRPSLPASTRYTMPTCRSVGTTTLKLYRH